MFLTIVAGPQCSCLPLQLSQDNDSHGWGSHPCLGASDTHWGQSALGGQGVGLGGAGTMAGRAHPLEQGRVFSSLL